MASGIDCGLQAIMYFLICSIGLTEIRHFQRWPPIDNFFQMIGRGYIEEIKVEH